MDSRNYSAKKYFIYGFKDYILNTNKIMTKRHFPSIREVIVDYINMYDERTQDINNKKLENAEKDMINSAKFYLKESIFYHQEIYKKEIDLILKSIEGDFAGRKNGYIMCHAFLKKMEKENFYERIVKLLMNTTNYGRVDKIIYSLVSELQYDGYSLSKLDKWYNNELKTRDITQENIDSKIEQFCLLKQNRMEFTFYVTIKLFDKESIYLGNNIVLSKQDIDFLEFPDAIMNYLQISNDTYIYKCKIEAMDVDKALEYLINAFDAYIQMNNYVYFHENNKGKTIELGEKIIVYSSREGYQKVRKVIQDERRIFHYNEEKEKRDIERFIKYRDRVYEEDISNEEVSNIQRALNIVKGQVTVNKESRIINLWSVLEYMLTFHEGKNIISKVQDIIPKVVTLYAIKDQINMFWSNLLKYEEMQSEVIGEFINNCAKVDDRRKYNLKKLITYILQQGEKLGERLAFNDVLLRGISSIGDILECAEKREKYIKQIYQEVEYDLVSIYRDRNALVHSGKKTVQDINGKILRLYSYNNSLLGVIIYYKSENPFFTIQEILNSICCTYNYYQSIISEEVDSDIIKLANICRPSYLFLE